MPEDNARARARPGAARPPPHPVVARAQDVDAVEPGERAPAGPPPAVGAAVRQHDREPLGGRLARQLARPPCAARAPGRCGPCRAARAGRRRAPPASATSPWRWRTSASAANAITLVLARSLRVEHDGRRRHRRQPDGVAAHRAAVVDEQAQRAPRRGPAAGDQLVGVRRPAPRQPQGSGRGRGRPLPPPAPASSRR